MNLSGDDVATLKRCLALITDKHLTKQSEAIVAVSDDGVHVRDYDVAVTGHPDVEDDDRVIPWIALTDPAEYARQLAEEAAAPVAANGRLRI